MFPDLLSYSRQSRKRGNLFAPSGVGEPERKIRRQGPVTYFLVRQESLLENSNNLIQPLRTGVQIQLTPEYP